jgi:hypothetical protein
MFVVKRRVTSITAAESAPKDAMSNDRNDVPALMALTAWKIARSSSARIAKLTERRWTLSPRRSQTIVRFPRLPNPPSSCRANDQHLAPELGGRDLEEELVVDAVVP